MLLHRITPAVQHEREADRLLPSIRQGVSRFPRRGRRIRPVVHRDRKQILPIAARPDPLRQDRRNRDQANGGKRADRGKNTQAAPFVARRGELHISLKLP